MSYQILDMFVPWPLDITTLLFILRAPQIFAHPDISDAGALKSVASVLRHGRSVLITSVAQRHKLSITLTFGPPGPPSRWYTQNTSSYDYTTSNDLRKLRFSFIGKIISAYIPVNSL